MKRHIGRVPNASVSFPHRIRACHPLGKSVCSPTRNFYQDSASWVFIGVLLCIHYSLNLWPHDWTQHTAPAFPYAEVGRLSWYHVPSSPNPLLMWLIFLAWPVPILSHLISIYHQHLPWMIYFSHFGNFKSLDRGFIPGTRDKVQLSSLSSSR